LGQTEKIWKKRGASYDTDWHKGVGKRGERNPNADIDWVAPAKYSHFCGEKILKEAYKVAVGYDVQGYFAGLFVTGARSSEFLLFKVSMFQRDEKTNTLYGYGLPVLKGGGDDDHLRGINVLFEDPLVPEFWSFVEYIRKRYGEDAYLTKETRNDRDEWLHKYDYEIEWKKKQISEIKKQSRVSIDTYQAADGFKKEQKELEKAQKHRLEKINYRLYQDVYNVITDIQKPPTSEIKRLRKEEKETGQYKVKTGPWFPHRLRMERASFLTSERGYDTPLLMTFFGWKRADTPTNYVKQSAQELLKRNIDARYDILWRKEASLQSAESSTPKDPVPKYLQQ
jgi:hypothetical protein